jgi:hypothetical protein
MLILAEVIGGSILRFAQERISALNRPVRKSAFAPYLVTTDSFRFARHPTKNQSTLRVGVGDFTG